MRARTQSWRAAFANVTNPMADDVAQHDPDTDPNIDIVVLTGAGLSAESGLRTFRDGGGL